MSYTQTPIRLQCRGVSDPLVGPMDANTGQAPRAWARQAVRVDLGVFGPDGAAVDLSEFDHLVLTLQDGPAAVSPLAVETVPKENIIDTVTMADWISGANQQATFNLSMADTDQGLGGANSKDFWIVVNAVGSDGSAVTLGAGTLTLYLSGAAIPPPQAGTVSFNAQANSGENSTVYPTYPVHQEIITLTGDAGVRSVALSAIGAEAGNRIELLFKVPLTAGIVVAIYSGSLSGSMVATFTSDGDEITSARYAFVYDGSAWQLAAAAIPAY